MTDILIRQMPAFRKVYKKLHSSEKNFVNEAIRAVVENPTVGQEKKGDLSGVFVYKFKVHRQEFLLAYEWNPKERLLLAFEVSEYMEIL